MRVPEEGKEMVGSVVVFVRGIVGSNNEGIGAGISWEHLDFQSEEWVTSS